MKDFEKGVIRKTLNLVNDLNKREMQVLMAILKLSKVDQQFTITQRKIAEETGVDQSNVSRSFDILRDKKLLIGNRINSEILSTYGFN